MRCAVTAGVEENTAAIIRSRLKTRLFTSSLFFRVADSVLWFSVYSVTPWLMFFGLFRALGIDRFGRLEANYTVRAIAEWFVG